MPIQVIYVTVETPVTEVVDVTVNGDAVDVVDVLVGPETAQLDTRTTALETLTTPSAWVDVTFQNSWANLHSLPCQYRKVGDMVQLRGRIGGGSSASTAFTLPVGFRTPYQYPTWPCAAYNGASVPGAAFLATDPTGAIVIYYASGFTDIGFELQFSVTA